MPLAPPSPDGGTFLPRGDRIGREARWFITCMRWGLEAIEAAPPSWTVTLALGENTREVALVNQTTELGCRDGKQDSTDNLGNHDTQRDLSCRPPAGTGRITARIHA